MFIVLLVVTFGIALLVSFIVARIFSDSLGRILARLIPEELSSAWHRYIVFALYVVGISGGVRVWSLEQYVLPRGPGEQAFVLTPERWTLEVYRTVIGTLQSVAWLLLVFFVFALIAYVVVRGLELLAARRAPESVAAKGAPGE